MRGDGNGYARRFAATLHTHNLPLAVDPKRSVRVHVLQDQAEADRCAEREREIRLKEDPGETDVTRDAFLKDRRREATGSDRRK